MDSEQFDRLVQRFGQSRSRRQTLRGLAGLAAVGVFALRGQEADASKHNGGSPCTKGKQCKTGKCVGDPGQKVCSCSTRYPKCPSGSTCQDGACTPEVACDAQSCPGGCCDGSTCKSGDADGACGSGGGDCRSCDAFPNSYCDTATGSCACDAACADKACGDDDGCGDSCQTGSCTGGRTCQDGTCTDTRAVSVSFERYDEWQPSCYVTVQVTGFASGTHSGSLDFTEQMDVEEFTIEVGTDGTGSWSSRSIWTIWAEGYGSVTATVDGVSSAEEPVTCPAA